MDAKKIGNTIAFLRKQFGMTQAELAQKLLVTDKAVSRWERGIGSPDISLLVRLSSVLDTDIEAILEGNFTHNENEYKGLLIMDYPDTIHADSFLHNKRIVCFQLSFFLLSGIREICIRGNPKDVEFAKSEFQDGSSLGITLFYESVKEKSELGSQKSEYFKQKNKTSSLLVIDGLDFLYGKGITSFLKRLLFDSVSSMCVLTYKKEPTALKFFPTESRMNMVSSAPSNSGKSGNFLLGRGIICFPIKDEKDLLDAGNITRLIEEHQGENIADLREIAQNRGFL